MKVSQSQNNHKLYLVTRRINQNYTYDFGYTVTSKSKYIVKCTLNIFMEITNFTEKFHYVDSNYMTARHNRALLKYTYYTHHTVFIYIRRLTRQLYQKQLLNLGRRIT